MRLRRRSLLLVIPITILLLTSLFLWRGGVWLVDADEPEAAEVAVVLAGDGYGLRIQHGARLVEEGFVPMVLASGNRGQYENWESELAIDFAVRAVRQGWPREYFTPFRHTAMSTAEELKAIREEFIRRGTKKAIFVTSDYHTRRTRRVLESTLSETDFLVVAAKDKYFRPQQWCWHRESRKSFLMEWTKNLAQSLGGL
jgi:uncharacterized SAM-binding protein YcdF (DUF218 family)